LKKFIVIFYFIPALIFGQKIQKKEIFEINAGLAEMRVMGLWPGVSPLLYCQIFQVKKGIVAEYKIGAALPSILTAKLGIGIGNLDYNIMAAIRPWPLSIGPQIVMGPMTFSYEWATKKDISMGAIWISTVGVRLKPGNRKKKKRGLF
tara:strand:+ start:1088 stop:1531 length:444 start_codon:yes stop_codon:yes gene_type:complete